MRIAMMPMTTISSMRVKAAAARDCVDRGMSSMALGVAALKVRRGIKRAPPRASSRLAWDDMFRRFEARRP
jgi:hypothetical protein